MYYEIYALLQDFIFGSAALTAWQDMTLTVLSTCANIFVVIIPFLVVYFVLRLIFDLMKR